MLKLGGKTCASHKIAPLERRNFLFKMYFPKKFRQMEIGPICLYVIPRNKMGLRQLIATLIKVSPCLFSGEG